MDQQNGPNIKSAVLPVTIFFVKFVPVLEPIKFDTSTNQMSIFIFFVGAGVWF